jgi:hypothetical protein
MGSLSAETLRFEWARHRSRGGLLDLVLEIEHRLRALVRAVLQQGASQQRIEPWTNLLAEYTRKVLVQRRPDARSSDLLDRATLGELIDIVLNQWDLFASLIGERIGFQTKVSEFREWRNRLAHGAVLTADQKVELAAVADEVSRHLFEPIDTNYSPGISARGASVLWVDDQPEGNLRERRVLRLLGIEVVPVRSNDEAVEVVSSQRST